MDGKLMAGNTPKQRYPQPFEAEGDIYPFGAAGPMSGTPKSSFMTGGYQTTPQANPAAVRAYTRNAPYMEEFMSDPQALLTEMHSLQQSLKREPNDPVSEYRLRILRQALADVFGMQAPDEIEPYLTYPGNLSSTPPSFEDYTFTGREITPQSRPMVQTMARRGRR